jgi:hypothetical protein
MLQPIVLICSRMTGLLVVVTEWKEQLLLSRAVVKSSWENLKHTGP